MLSLVRRAPRWIVQAATAASIPHLVTILRLPAFSDNPSAPSNAPGMATNERTSTNLRWQARDRGREARSREEAKKSVPMGSSIGTEESPKPRGERHRRMRDFRACTSREAFSLSEKEGAPLLARPLEFHSALSGR
jgi:hypothetical protein